MGLMEIFELSQVSRRVLNCLHLSRIRVQTVQVASFPAVICIRETECPLDENFMIHFVQTPKPVVDQMTVNNVRINVCEKNARLKVIHCNSNQFGYGLVHVLTHFDKIFYRIDFAFGFELNTLNSMRGLLCHPIFRKCDYVQFRGENETLSNEDCEYLLEKTQPTTGITIFCKLSPDFDYKKILHFSRLRVPNLGKMPLEDLKALDSEIANLGNHEFTESDINEFLHHWIKGNNRKLRRLKLDGFREAPDWDILLKDVVHTEWNSKQRGRYYKSKYTDEVETIDCEDGKDFKNKYGQLATVVYHSEFLDFLIWNDRFPE
ncbi:hypothetical protein GCK72_000130 [Caenorhabditis remanei]|uniref:Sdz-33 F-box domain-containing protein n=1 Tax=Caenorhabditis remanei TaxID=31234 RepID=A0A6A5HKA9_CAERE|nr:hypothetical protein GCK72_000130 [Caenorhabditis remanei]KAF1768318.1 hypothetical protein GCK72_000130 [Caenorhabditis remanei]